MLPSSVSPALSPTLRIPNPNTFLFFFFDKMAAEGQEIPEEVKGEQIPPQEDGVDDEVRVIGVVPLH